jgi:hypothetical protein
MSFKRFDRGSGPVRSLDRSNSKIGMKISQYRKKLRGQSGV